MALTRMFENMAGSDQHLKWKVEARPRTKTSISNWRLKIPLIWRKPFRHLETFLQKIPQLGKFMAKLLISP